MKCIKVRKIATFALIFCFLLTFTFTGASAEASANANANVFTPTEFIKNYEENAYDLVDAIMALRTSGNPASGMNWQRCNLTKTGDVPVHFRSADGDFEITFFTDDEDTPANCVQIAVTNESKPFVYVYPFIATMLTYGANNSFNVTLDAFTWLDLVEAIDNQDLSAEREFDDFKLEAVQKTGDYSLVITVADKDSEIAKNYTELKRGDKGDKVTELQEKLNAAGYSVGNVDGDFGGKTLNALMSYQKDKLLIQSETFSLVDYLMLLSESTADSSGSTQATANGEADNTGWYTSDDGKLSLKPVDLWRNGDGTYTVTLKARTESTGYEEDIELQVQPDGNDELTLSETNTIQDFESKGNGEYSFTVSFDTYIGVVPIQMSVTYTIQVHNS